MKNLNNNELLMKSLINCGILTRELCAKHDISLEIIEEMVRIGYIVEKNNIIKLTSYGKSFVLNTFDGSISLLYTGYIDSHDIKLVEFYLALSEKEKETWVTRNQIQLATKNRPFDGSYINKNGEKICVAILKKNCEKTVINELEETLKELGSKLTHYAFY